MFAILFYFAEFHILLSRSYSEKFLFIDFTEYAVRNNYTYYIHQVNIKLILMCFFPTEYVHFIQGTRNSLSHPSTTEPPKYPSHRGCQISA